MSKKELDEKQKICDSGELRNLAIVLSLAVAVVLTFAIAVIIYVDSSVRIRNGELIIFFILFLVIYAFFYLFFCQKLGVKEKEYNEYTQIIKEKLSESDYKKVEYIYPLSEILPKEVIEQEPEFFARKDNTMIDIECRDKKGNRLNAYSGLYSYQYFSKNFRLN